MLKVASLSLNSAGGPHFPILEKHGFQVSLAAEGANLFDEGELIKALQGCVAVVAGSEPYTRRVIESSPQLRCIVRSGVGYDAVDLAICDANNIAVCTTPGVNHHAVAEHTLSLLMGVARGFPALDQQVRRGYWVRKARPRVMGSTLGIVGLGRIGRAVATRANGLGLKLLAFDPYASKEFAEQWDIELVSLDDLLARSDYVSLHLPSTRETRHLFNAAAFAKMKHGAVLINTARGSLVNEPDLVQALQSGQLRAAGLDVFEVEPLSTESPLLKMENVLLSGHVAGLDEESHNDTFVMCAEIIVDLYNGRWPTECVRNLAGVKNWKW